MKKLKELKDFKKGTGEISEKFLRSLKEGWEDDKYNVIITLNNIEIKFPCICDVLKEGEDKLAETKEEEEKERA